MAGRRPSPAPTVRKRPRARQDEVSFPIVGIGASAGGLEAFGRVLSTLPADTGAAFVLVQHLDPQHESILASLLARTTAMPVRETTDGTRIEPDHVYVIPPTVDIALADGHIRHVARGSRREPHLPIDLFLGTLADVKQSQAVAVILSGTGTDGTQGCRAVKEGGGIALAQAPESAKFAGMPQSAIDSECVDVVLPPEAIGAEIARLVAGRSRGSVDRVSGAARPSEADRFQLARIFTMLRNATGADFSCYKKTTLKRRVERRMALLGIEQPAAYATLLEGQPAELQQLHNDLLINVTSFFRDPLTFEALKADVLPRLLRARPADLPIRVWVPGCATGEEAYSIAMCLLEVQGSLGVNTPIQVFASDLADAAVQKARSGSYPESVDAQVSRERLLRFFVKEAGRYQVSKAVRDLLVFAHHDLTRDPPFSRMDLVSCRNVLIYLEASLQKRVLATLHYALQPDGLLLLGQAETIGPASDAFTVVDREHKVYAKRAQATPAFLRGPPAAGPRAVPPAVAPVPLRTDQRTDVVRESQRLLLERYAPASVLVDHKDDVFHFRGDTEPYLGHAEGAASFQLTKLARKGLLPDLRRLLLEARARNAAVRKTGLALRHRGRTRRVALEAIPIRGPGSGEQSFLVIFDDGSKRAPAASVQLPRSASAEKRHIAQLEQEVQALEHYQQATQQDHEAASEELQSANEEIVSSNEELQSINEEMETAKEELQSNNEELMTLNEELQTRNLELQRLHDDLDNFFASATIPVLMLSRDLLLRRLTPAAGTLLGILPTDIGRPLGRLVLQVDPFEVEVLVLGVIETMLPVERELQDGQGRWWRLHVRPYRTSDKRIDGAVLVLLDIDLLKRNQRIVEEARDFADAIVDTAREPLLILDRELRVRRTNQAFCETFGFTRAETEGTRFEQLMSGQWAMAGLLALLEDVLATGRSFGDHVVAGTSPETHARTLVLNARRLRQETTRGDLILLAIEDCTVARHVDEERAVLLHRAEAAASSAESANRLKDEFVANASHELRGPLSAMLTWTHLLSNGPTDAVTMTRGLAAIERSARTQTHLIEDLMDVTRITLGKMRLAMRLHDLRPVVEAALETARSAAQAKNVSLSVTCTSSESVLGDQERLQQVFWNLISNAVKFTPAGGRVVISYGRVGTFVEVRVSDDGRGIASSFLPYVFERFRQADGSPSRQQPGLGLGLAIVRQLVEMHGGTVSAESPGEGLGATFVVSLPVPAIRTPTAEEAGPETAPPARPSHAKAGPSLAGLDVLIVDDDDDGREAVRAVLEQRGAKVRAAASVDDALLAFEASTPDVLVSDIGMPRRDGYELIRNVRLRAPDRGGNVPALALTAYAASDDRQKTTAAGFQEYLAKPAEPVELVWRVARLAGLPEAG
jgi:two-component system CheB/CheR fusion protein